MKLWEVKEKKCIENIRMSNTIHRNIYVFNILNNSLIKINNINYEYPF